MARHERRPRIITDLVRQVKRTMGDVVFMINIIIMIIIMIMMIIIIIIIMSHILHITLL